MKKPKIRKSNISSKYRHRKIYSPEERQTFSHFFAQERERGVEVKELAEKLGVSTATLYRWQRSNSGLTKPSICIPPNLAMERLCDPGVSEESSLVAAVIALSVWIRWPTDLQYHDAASAALAVAYVGQKTKANILGEIAGQYRQLVDAIVPTDFIWKSCTNQALDFPIFSEYRIDGQPHTESNVVRDVVWYLLSHSGSEQRNRYKPSLNKAFYLLENDAFKFHWKISERTFQKFWHRMAPSAPFKFVEQDSSSLNWYLDPSDPMLSSYIDEILKDRKDLLLFLSKCHWVTEMLIKILHSKALDNIAFPSFPKDLPQMPFEVVGMPDSMIDLLAAYRG